MRKLANQLSLCALLGALLWSGHALAYIGPGAGITVLGALWGVVVAIFLAIGAVLFWPVRILFRRRKRQGADGRSEQPEAKSQQSDSSTSIEPDRGPPASAKSAASGE